MYRYVLESASPITLVSEGPPPPPPPPPPVPVDETPFLWPTQPTIPSSDDPTLRYFYLGFDPKGNETTPDWYYNSALAEYPNPRPRTHQFAGYLTSGHRVWAPVSGTPASIRRVLRGEYP